MTSPRRFDQDLPILLEGLYLAGTPDYRDDLVQRIAATRQRPAWTFLQRWLPMDITTERVATPRLPWRAIGVLALIALLIAASLAAFVGSRPRLPDPFGFAASGSVIHNQAGDVFVRDAIDGPSRILIGGPETDFGVAFSPRGTQLLVARESGSEIDLLVARADGSALTRIGGPYQALGRMEWSPDESTIAIGHTLGDVETISLVRADGSGERALDVGMPADSPSWRPPDGSQLAFRGRADGAWGLFVVDADGSGSTRLDVPRALLEDPYEVLEPAWSPSGDQLAFHRLVLTPGEGNGNGFRITVANVSRANVVTAVETPTFVDTSDDEHHVAWTPAGDGLVFLRRDGEIDSIATVSLVDQAVLEIDVTSVGSFGGLAFTVAPDGRTLMAHKWDTNTDWVVDLSDVTVRRWDVDSDDGTVIQRIAP